MNVHVPSTLPNIDDIVAGHDRSLELYRAAFSKIEEAHKAIEEAYAEIERVTPGARFHESRDAQEVGDFHKAVRLPDRNIYLNTAAKLLTLRCWHYVVDRCGLQQLMDVEAKKKFDASLRYVPERPKNRRE
nr:hypothetical protein [Hyphomicrobium sp.]